MSLAQKVRDFRYSKGWGPDELANRAEISRTALYQIESGKTGLPRAGTLRRIAVALEVPMEDLLGDEVDAMVTPTISEHSESSRRGRSLSDWLPSEGTPLSMPPTATSGRSPQSVLTRCISKWKARSRPRPTAMSPSTSAKVSSCRSCTTCSTLRSAKASRGSSKSFTRSCHDPVHWSDWQIPRHGSILSGRFPQGTATR